MLSLQPDDLHELLTESVLDYIYIILRFEARIYSWSRLREILVHTILLLFIITCMWEDEACSKVMKKCDIMIVIENNK